MSTIKKSRQNASVIIRNFLSRKTTQKAFCHEKGIALSTLQFWLRRHRQQGPKEHAPAFVPLAIASSPKADNNQPNSCAIQYPNGVTVRCSGSVDISFLSQPIKAKVI